MKQKDELTVRELRAHLMAGEKPLFEAIVDRAYRWEEHLDQLNEGTGFANPDRT